MGYLGGHTAGLLLRSLGFWQLAVGKEPSAIDGMPAAVCHSVVMLLGTSERSNDEDV